MRASDGGPAKVRASNCGPARMRASGSGPAKVRASSGGPMRVRDSGGGPARVRVSWGGLTKVRASGAAPARVRASGGGPTRVRASCGGLARVRASGTVRSAVKISMDNVAGVLPSIQDSWACASAGGLLSCDVTACHVLSLVDVMSAPCFLYGNEVPCVAVEDFGYTFGCGDWSFDLLGNDMAGAHSSVAKAHGNLCQEEISDKNLALYEWLWQLRDVIDEADDVLDDLEYMKHETNNQ
ncbi:hypothetical protein MA16_Dca013447 [Dendrobium catenatum]|uniref:Uncharacterized protein n=1 Tax=Dendrobium catenatum TaxID=906689 RepID=A0A2I0WPR6_9ASPA|nr:hypothetical protein MA16_Dca013447 [Dendrobium catenatum]